MPEGDTLYRTAVTLRRWLEGRTITGVRSVRRNVPADRILGTTVDGVEARGKHLLIRLSSGDVVHTHLQMTGSWHVYGAGDRWRKPGHLARLVLEAGDRVAVCFNAPTVELLAAGEERRHPALVGLGPDVLVDPFDPAEVRRRAGEMLPPDSPVGDLLLDQQVVAGIGNIWRCEALFVRRIAPDTPWSVLSDDDLDALVSAASTLMRGAIGGRTGTRSVYGRAGRPCPRCRTLVRAARQGRHARTAYWCPACQPHL
ncbi:MAG TPA: DNA-formamidopyrimidine glycosylase family protein [Acidimicrobiales bacterium]|nr:DNA-formamidopyrimidine glycosylase family protein [Acidimicrobiales bacterium]